MVTLLQIDQRRRQIDSITTLAISELVAVWPTLALDDAAELQAQMVTLLPLIGNEYADALGASSADWYEDLRWDAVGASRPFTARIADVPEDGQYRALIGWALQPLINEDNPTATLSRLSGGAQRLIRQTERQTIIENANTDPLTVKHARTASPGACAFCAMLASRGGVYNDESVRFRAHDNCRCMSVPVFPEETLERPTFYADWDAAYEQARNKVRAETGKADTKAILAEMRRILGIH